jgi:hypothetical protein
MAKPDKVEDKTKKALTVAAVILLIGVATSFEGQGYVCPWSPPWWWPFSDCMWYGLTCARSAG